MIEDVKDFYRQELFDHYNSCTNPFIIMTTKLDVTKKQTPKNCKIQFYKDDTYYIE